jgi:hypothetical protein
MSGGREVGRRLGVRKIFNASRSGEHANGLRNREGRVGARRAALITAHLASELRQGTRP